MSKNEQATGLGDRATVEGACRDCRISFVATCEVVENSLQWLMVVYDADGDEVRGGEFPCAHWRDLQRAVDEALYAGSARFGPVETLLSVSSS